MPRILVIDDLFGRCRRDGDYWERRNLCAALHLHDVSGHDEAPWRGRTPLAEAVFRRGQRPAMAVLGDEVVNDPEAAVAEVAAGWTDERGTRAPWALVLVDLAFYSGVVTERSERGLGIGMAEGRPGDVEERAYFGLELLQRISHACPDQPVAVLSSKPRDPVSLDVADFGACAFLERAAPDVSDQLRRVLARHGLIPDEEIVGRSLPLLKALRVARTMATSRKHVLLRGERGTGKELFARYIHRMSGVTGPYECVSAASLLEGTSRSELEGYRRGAFTGAVKDTPGAFARAAGGDLFLDEIGDLDAGLQPAMLRLLQERVAAPVGGVASHPLDVRVISATNLDIDGFFREGGPPFRADLLDRLREGGTLTLPPLRERPEDIPLLVERFLRDAEAQLDARPRRVSTAARERLLAHDWPGNIRELQTVIFNAVREYPDVEHLVPRHLLGLASPATPRALEALDPVQALQALQFEDLSDEALAGLLPRLEREARDLLLRYLEAVRGRLPVGRGAGRAGPLLATMRRALGDDDLRATAAADAFRRIDRLGRGVPSPLDSAPLRELREAAETVRR